MSISINKYSISKEQLRNLIVKIEPDYKADYVQLYEINGLVIILPFAYTFLCFGDKVKDILNYDIHRKYSVNSWKRIIFKNIGLTEQQQKTEEKAENILLKKHRVIFMYHEIDIIPCAIKLVIKQQLKTLCITSKPKLWKERVDYYTNGTIKVQNLNKNVKMNTNFQFFTIGVKDIQNMDTKYFFDFGTVIIDEIKEIFNYNSYDTVLKLFPVYLVGISDEIQQKNTMIEYYFGDTKVYN